MHTTTLRMACAAGGALLLAGIVASPALADDYPPSNPASDTDSNNSGGTDSNTSSGTETNTSSGTVTSSGDTPAYTGAATTLGLAAAVVALGAGAGLLVASRRRNDG
jgi:hypothetical protein